MQIVRARTRGHARACAGLPKKLNIYRTIEIWNIRPGSDDPRPPASSQHAPAPDAAALYHTHNNSYTCGGGDASVRRHSHSGTGTTGLALDLARIQTRRTEARPADRHRSRVAARFYDLHDYYNIAMTRMNLRWRNGASGGVGRGRAARSVKAGSGARPRQLVNIRSI
ncbi:hypothetical protein KGM_200742 [Danaus plexippus plexippus]|uniref:Uncharacterized protein n=1 Tax=Danaus plexippus plexippus TaxID=278856 RepID=A0A212EX76_DANPL|nr:hypothetical protein KGM_200742 [Danaus plexippus plexippus]